MYLMSPHEESVVHDFFKDIDYEITNRDDIRFDASPLKKSHHNYLEDKPAPQKQYFSA